VLAALAAGGSCRTPTQPATTVILVRHAEKLDDSPDTPLSATGEARAAALATALERQPVNAIYATQYLRTQQTARPLAEAHGVPITVHPFADGYARAMADLIRTRHGGETVVVVGHSNTTPAIIAALGILNPPTIPDGEYDDLFVVTVPARGPARLLRLRYGAPTP
jgi:broad specificity phosphatase PhoE